MPLLTHIDMTKHFKWGDFVSFIDLDGHEKVGFVIETSSALPEYDILAEHEPDTYMDVWYENVKAITRRQLNDKEFIEAHPFAMKVYTLRKQNQELMAKVWEYMPRKMPEATHPLWELYHALLRMESKIVYAEETAELEDAEEKIKGGEKLYHDYLHWRDELWDVFGAMAVL